MFGSDNIETVTVAYTYDPGADERLPLWQAPKACEILSATATVVNDVAASTSDYFSVALINGGSAGDGTAVLAAAIGGTPGWTGLKPKAFTLSEGTLAKGDVVEVDYDETGTATFGVLVVQLNVVYGLGAVPA